MKEEIIIFGQRSKVKVESNHFAAIIATSSLIIPVALIVLLLFKAVA